MPTTLHPTPEPVAGLTFDRPRIMGILNVTPDSFSDGGRYFSIKKAVDRALAMAQEGADIIDIGGESTRPGARPVGVAEELDRVLPVIEACRMAGCPPVSVDTRKAEVMMRGLQAGASLVNDVSALTFDGAAIDVISRTGAPVVLMHAQGTPETMQQSPRYGDVVAEVYAYLEARIAACAKHGIPRQRIIVDPGIGFGKTVAHNLELLRNLDRFHALGCAILLGASRKRFIAKIIGSDTADRLAGSLAAAALGFHKGIQLYRVHDVAETRQFLAVLQAARAAG